MHEHGTKTTPVFLPADRQPLGCYFQVRSPYSFHLPKPVSTDLTIKPDSVLMNPIGKDTTNPALITL